MDIESAVFFMSIYKLAEATGLMGYIKEMPKKSVDAILEKIVQDDLLSKFFPPTHERAFKAALQGIAPFDQDTIRYKLILSLLTEQEIIDALKELERGQLPERQLLVSAFQKVFPGENVSRFVDLFIDNLYNELKKDQETVNLVTLRLQEKIEEIREASRVPRPQLREDAFLMFHQHRHQLNPAM